MSSLGSLYDRWRRNTFPASRADISSKHDELVFRIAQSTQAIIEKVDRSFVRRICNFGEPLFDESLSTLARTERITFGLSKEMRVLEVGPSHNPVAPKRDGWNAYVLDHLSQEGLIEKYRNDPTCDVSRIEPVDYVWSGQELDELIPADMLGTFDACISSHSIEHTPDFLGFFKSMSNILSPTGLVCMAVPDKRFSFDYFRPHSTTGQVIEAHQQGRTKHSLAALIDESLYRCTNNGEGAWGQQFIGDLRLSSTANLGEIYQSITTVYKDEYIDSHGWQFTPASFSLIILELRALGLIDFEIEKISDSVGCEFTVQLRKTSQFDIPEPELHAKRLKLLRTIVEDLGIQSDFQRAGLII